MNSLYLLAQWAAHDGRRRDRSGKDRKGAASAVVIRVGRGAGWLASLLVDAVAKVVGRGRRTGRGGRD